MSNKIQIYYSDIVTYWSQIIEFMRAHSNKVVLSVSLPLSDELKKKIKVEFDQYNVDTTFSICTHGFNICLDFDDKLCTWLLKQNPFNPKLRGIKKDESCGIDISFFQGEEEVLWISRCYDTALSRNRDFGKLFDNFIFSQRKASLPEMYAFIERWNECEKQDKDLYKEFVTYDFNIQLLLNIFDRTFIKQNKLSQFYYNSVHMRVIAELLVDKISDKHEEKSKLFDWFLIRIPPAYRNQNYKEIPGAETIYNFLLSIPDKEFIEIFPYHPKEFNSYYIYKLSSLLHERNLCLSQFGDCDIMKIIDLWSSEDINSLNKKENILLMYINVANKYVSQDKRKKVVYAIRRKKDYYPVIERFYKRAERIYLYFYGIFTPQDLVKAFRLLKVASKEDNCECQFDLARCYLNGWGTEKDIEQAKYWFTKAAENGHPKAQEQLDLISKS